MRANIRHLEPGRPAREGQLILTQRHRIVRSVIGNALDAAYMLDIGCGNGAQTKLFKPDVKRLVGLDYVPLKETESSVEDAGIEFVRGDAMRLPFGNDVFDVVTSFEVLEHLEDDTKAVLEIRRVLKPGGIFLFSVPNKWWIFESHGANIPGLNWIPWNRAPFLGWLPRGIHERIAKARIYTIRRATALVKHYGFIPLESGYITAPLDVLPNGWLKSFLKKMFFRGDTTRNPLKAVNLFIVAKKKRANALHYKNVST